MVIFDVPEEELALRQRLRLQLKKWDFIQVQKSVWATDMDYKDHLIMFIDELGLRDCVEIYESAKLFPK